ncbi:hypothetical protein LXL04_004168 [Taraxacum kok-saghyz]
MGTGTTGYCDSSLGLSFNFKSGTSPCLSLSPSFSFNFKSQFQISTPHQVDFCDMESDSSSDHDEVSKQRGPTIKSKTKKGKAIITYNKKGVPIGEESKKLSTFEGMTARTMVPITYQSWREIPFVVDLKSRKNSLKSVGSKWRNFKHYLFKKFIEKYKNDPKPKFPRPETYPFIEKADWKLFVAQRLSKKWQKKSDYAKKASLQENNDLATEDFRC